MYFRELIAPDTFEIIGTIEGCANSINSLQKRDIDEKSEDFKSVDTLQLGSNSQSID